MCCNCIRVLYPRNVSRFLWQSAVYVWRGLTCCCTSSAVSGLDRISPTLVRLVAASHALWRSLLSSQGSTSSAAEADQGPQSQDTETGYQNAVPVSGVSNKAYCSDSDSSPRNIDSSPDSSTCMRVPMERENPESGERSIRTSNMAVASQDSSSDMFESVESCPMPMKRENRVFGERMLRPPIIITAYQDSDEDMYESCEPCLITMEEPEPSGYQTRPSKEEKSAQGAPKPDSDSKEKGSDSKEKGSDSKEKGYGTF